MICNIVLLAFLVLLTVVTSIQFKNGNPDFLLNGWDESGHVCGLDGDYKNYPFFYYVIAVNTDMTPEQIMEHLREKIEKLVDNGTISQADILAHKDWFEAVKNGAPVSMDSIPKDLLDKYGKYFDFSDGGL